MGGATDAAVAEVDLQWEDGDGEAEGEVGGAAVAGCCEGFMGHVAWKSRLRSEEAAGRSY